MSLTLTVKQKINNKRITVEMDAGKLERLAASFGFLNPDFLSSLDKAERDYENKRYHKIKSLRELNNQK